MKYRVTVAVSGEIELIINASSADKADEIAQKIAGNLHIDNRGYSLKSLIDVEELVDYEVTTVHEEE